MIASELREFTAEELRIKDRELSEQLFALRLQKVTGQLESPARVGQIKRDRARVLTVLREKQQEETTEAPA